MGGGGSRLLASREETRRDRQDAGGGSVERATEEKAESRASAYPRTVRKLAVQSRVLGVGREQCGIGGVGALVARQGRPLASRAGTRWAGGGSPRVHSCFYLPICWRGAVGRRTRLRVLEKCHPCALCFFLAFHAKLQHSSPPGREFVALKNPVMARERFSHAIRTPSPRTRPRRANPAPRRADPPPPPPVAG